MSQDESTIDKKYGPKFEPDVCVPSTGIGPAIPPHLLPTEILENELKEENDCDVGIIGPMAPGNELVDVLRHYNSSTSAIDHTSNGTEEKPVRDAWMTELMPVTRDAALKPRKFKMNVGGKSGPDASWFTCPNDPESKMTNKQLSKMNEERLVDKAQHEASRQRDSVMRKAVDQYNAASKRSESLLDLHEQKIGKKKQKSKEKKKKHKKKHKKHKKRKHSSSSSDSSSDEDSSSSSSSSDDTHCKRSKKKKKRKDSPPRRIPFDREKDMKVNELDDAKKRSIIQRSKELNSKFAPGRQQFL